MKFLRKLKTLLGSQPDSPDGADPGTLFLNAVKKYQDVLSAIEPFSARANSTIVGEYPSYTERYLAAHTSAMGTVAVQFGNVSQRFKALSGDLELYATAASIYGALAAAFQIAAEAYQTAANEANISALNMQLEAAKEEFDAFIAFLAANRDVPDDNIVSEFDAHRKAQSDTSRTDGKRFEQAAIAAQEMAEALCESSQSACAEVDSIISSFNS